MESGETSPDGSYKFNQFVVATRDGYILVRTFWHKSHDTNKICQNTELFAVKAGREYIRLFKKCYTARGAVTKAKQFAKEIYGTD